MSAVRATIVVPSFNHAAWVVECVESALAQTERDVEIVVIDDGSTDESLVHLARLSDPRLEVIAQSNAGLSTTLNRALARARGRWIKFLPSDDALEPQCIARQLAAADAAPGVRLVFSLPTVVDADGSAHPDPAPQAWFDHTPEGREAILRDLLERNFVCAPAVLFDRDLARVVGGFDPGLRIAQDYDLWMKMLPWAPAAYVRERLVRVRWHGANQSGVVTPESEAERACVVRGALERFGIARWIELFRAGTEQDGPEQATQALAEALSRSGLRELAPLAMQLRSAPARARDRSGVRRLASAVGRVLRRSAEPHASLPPVLAGPGAPRPEHWILVAAHAAATARIAPLADAFAASGASVTLAAPNAGPGARHAGVRCVASDLATLRTLAGDRDERVHVVVQEPEASAIALVREARLAGVRVLYDRMDGALPLTRAAIDSERALIDAADDLIGASRAGVKQLAVSRRLVHLLPDAADREAMTGRASALRGIVARPTVVVAVSCSRADRVATVTECLAQLEASRGAIPYRIVAVDDGIADDVLDELAARDEAGELQLVRNALRGRPSGHNLILRATASELVVLLDADRRVPGPGWLDAPVATLLADRRVGAVVERGRGPESGWAWIAPRRVLRRLGGFDDVHDPAGLEDLDQQQQLLAAGYRVTEWASLGPVPVPTRRHGVTDGASHERAVRRFTARWPDAPLPVDWARIIGEV